MSLQELEYKPGTYLAFVLSEESRAKLIALKQPAHKQLICHHVTVYFGLTESKLKEIQEMFSFWGSNKDPNVKVAGYLATDELDLFTVTIEGLSQRKKPLGGYYHITHSVAAGVKPVRSNTVLELKQGKPSESLSVFLDGEFKLEKA